MHIAGTNGKGSTSLIVAKSLCLAGYKVGRFTSPHIHSYLERFNIDGKTITALELKKYIDEIEQVIKREFADNVDRPTEFEVLTAIAFKWFKDNEVDIVLLEVGMGGIYDSTNVITPEISIITSIDLDHTQFLGNTIAEIAQNKAGIIKREIPIIIGELPQEAYAVIEKIANDNKAPLYKADKNIIVRADNKGLLGYELDIKMGENILKNIFFSLPGDYQLANLATALTAIKILKEKGYLIKDDIINQTLSTLKMPGRLEVISKDPLVILDVAHNAEGARAVNKALQKLLLDKPKVLLCGIVDDKDAYTVLKYLGQNTVRCIIARPEGRRGENWLRLLPVWQELFPEILVHTIEDINEAVNYSLEQLNDEEYLLICGSFYIIDKARRVFTTT